MHKAPTGTRLSRMRQYRRNFGRMYPDGPERMAAAGAASKLAVGLMRRFAPLLAAVWFVGAACGWAVRAMVVR